MAFYFANVTKPYMPEGAANMVANQKNTLIAISAAPASVAATVMRAAMEFRRSVAWITHASASQVTYAATTRRIRELGRIAQTAPRSIATASAAPVVSPKTINQNAAIYGCRQTQSGSTQE